MGYREQAAEFRAHVARWRGALLARQLPTNDNGDYVSGELTPAKICAQAQVQNPKVADDDDVEVAIRPLIQKPRSAIRMPTNPVKALQNKMRGTTSIHKEEEGDYIPVRDAAGKPTWQPDTKHQEELNEFHNRLRSAGYKYRSTSGSGRQMSHLYTKGENKAHVVETPEGKHYIVHA